MPWPSGQERRLIDHDVDATRYFLKMYLKMYPALSWSPDGRWLAFHERPPGSPVNRIVRVSLDTREKQPLTAPPENTQGDMYPAFSPDGAWLAFARSSALFGAWDVWVQPVKGRRAPPPDVGTTPFHLRPDLVVRWLGDRLLD